MTIYLKFPDQQTALHSLVGAGYILSEYKDHFQGNGWGTILQNTIVVDGVETDEWLVNIYDCLLCPESLLAYEIPEPKNPLNRVAL